MTVGELINILKEYDQDKEVLMFGDCYDGNRLITVEEGETEVYLYDEE